MNKNYYADIIKIVNNANPKKLREELSKYRKKIYNRSLVVERQIGRFETLKEEQEMLSDLLTCIDEIRYSIEEIYDTVEAMNKEVKNE